jgi:ribonuclease R
MKRKNKSNTTDWQSRDPNFTAEQGRYEDPVPSRALIIETLKEHDGPLNVDELIGHFQLTKLNQQSALEKRLGAMIRDGQLVQNRKGAYGPVAQMNAIPGVIQAHRDGFGFLIRDEGGPDIFLPPRQMRSVMNGDRVLVRITGTDFKGRPEGTLVEVLERGSREVVGRLHVDQGISYVIPDNPRVQQDLLIPPEARGGAKQGQMVVAEITAPPGHRTLPVGKVIEILGDHLAPGMEIEAAIRAHNLPYVFPHEVEAQAARIPDTVQPSQIAGRKDLRELPLVTIDGADARDFDDAVYAKPMRKGILGGGGGWTLWVAIADVAAYVTPDSPLDVEALLRGNSVYFPQRVIPMLPEKLSNGLCSLNPNVDRLCMVCEMRVMPDGEVAKSVFYEAVMRSQARLIYEDVAAILDNPQGPEAQNVPHVVPHLLVLNQVFEALFAAREKRGAIDFETTETRIVFDGDRKIDRVVPIKRNRAHRLIEECMVAANVESARRVSKMKIAAPYRIHEKPDTVKVQALREFLTERGLKLGGSDRPDTQDYAAMLSRTKDRPDQPLIQTVMLRSLMQARYSAENLGHFGLALTHYSHFTSPIRRYPDLLLHRALKHLIHKKPVKEFAYSVDAIEKHGAHCSMTERRADEATREVTTWLKCEYMSHHVGEEHDGVVSGVAPFGLFIELSGLYVEGLVHVSQLKNDYYQFEARHHRLIGDRSGQTYNLGDSVRVKVVRVNLDERKIDLELLAVKTANGRSLKIKDVPRESRAQHEPKSGSGRNSKNSKSRRKGR